ncbi:hypothetical protein HG263_10315 [Pseudoalteromonas sp. JBTF-M23]|uniref:Uncharacterized protein n=1 Tax=Pseudoalteromonas caenipelagi TaxID=2726988 RepID=A0A849VGC1_9GAMM|nr:hypothetical protein [Pseudoalteromonas caenipelagi]NOU50924.1 hypothetical protein [Pseudoalteromonas caenipelagi]
MSKITGKYDYLELKRRVDLVMSSFIQEFFLRRENQCIHPVELLNKLMILCQHPLTFAIYNKGKGKVRTYIDNDEYGKKLEVKSEALAKEQESYFPIFAIDNKECQYGLLAFQIYRDDNSSRLKFIHVNPREEENVRESTKIIQKLLAIFFAYFTEHNPQIIGISEEFSNSIHDGLEQHFNSIINSYPSHSGLDVDFLNTDQIFEINKQILESAYSEKVRYFSKTVKKLNESKSISNLPNIVFYQKQVRAPNLAPRVSINQANEGFHGYPFDTRIVISERQYQDLSDYLTHFRREFKNKGESFFPLNKIKSYSSLSCGKTKIFVEKYDKLFLDILCDIRAVNSETGEVINGTPDMGIRNLLDIYLQDTSDDARSFADPVLSTGLIHIRYPFANASPFLGYQQKHAEKCCIRLLQLVIQHYIFEGLSPGTIDREKTSLALVTFPIYISGRVPMTVSHILHVENGNESGLDSGVWDHAFYLTQFLSREIKSNLRKSYWETYLHQVGDILEQEILALFSSELEEQSWELIVQAINGINQKLDGLRYLFPFFKIVFTPTEDLKHAKIKFANIGFNMTTEVNQVYYYSSVGNPYHPDTEKAEKTVINAIEQRLGALSDKVMRALFFDVDINVSINPVAFVTTALIDSLELGLTQKLVYEKLKEKWSFQHGLSYVYEPEAELREFALKLTFNKRLAVLDFINRAQHNEVVFPKYKKSDELKDPLDYLKKYYGPYLSYFNDEKEDYIFWDELGKIDNQFKEALRKHLERKKIDQQSIVRRKNATSTYRPVVQEQLD